MAIIDEFTVNILVNGQPCKEYGGGTESGGGPKKITKYIEAISDAPYNISLEVSPSFEFTTTAIVLKISIDGYLVQQCCVRPDNRGIRHTISEIPGGAGYHSFSFISIKRSKSNPEYSGWELACLLSEAKGEDPLDPYISDDDLNVLERSSSNFTDMMFPNKLQLGCEHSRHISKYCKPKERSQGRNSRNLAWA